MASQSRGLWEGLRKWYYARAGFNQLGLMRDDTLRMTPIVKEALRRLPEDQYNERAFRIKRAFNLTIRHSILPKEEWTKYEEDSRYLKPYIDEIERELKEKREWTTR
ncbi:cytochrome b-c1 complex subunit 7-like [Acanthaster planci]|uniref:Cytochrome b-c1 complex subunit 7 n=1 Tax=Acanthaster planci TaxID=133434 RepID=A0A8B7Z940_ACAPL|nr:cytochrome b-c1 complex subunit 7-like [Acanthaster planci]